jgi:hypothetical protein
MTIGRGSSSPLPQIRPLPSVHHSLSPVSFQSLTNPFPRNLFHFTSLQIAGGGVASDFRNSHFRPHDVKTINSFSPTFRPANVQTLRQSFAPLLSLFCTPQKFRSMFSTTSTLFCSLQGVGVRIFVPTFPPSDGSSRTPRTADCAACQQPRRLG